MIKKIALVVLATLLLVAVTTLIRFQWLLWDCLISFCAFSLTTFCFIRVKVLSLKLAVILFTSVFTAILITAFIIDSALPSVGAFNMLCCYLGIWCGAVLAAKRPGIFVKAFSIILVLSVIFWYIFSGAEYWFNYINFGTFKSRIEASIPDNWYFYNERNDTLTTNNLDGKTVILDFWNTGCVVCFEKFPLLENLYQQHKADSNFLIAAVNIPWERDSIGIAFDKIERLKKYNFPVFVASDGMMKQFEIAVFPTVFVIKNDKIIYKGNIEGAAALVAQ